MKINKEKVAMYIAVIGVFLLTIGLSYALFNYIGTGSTENTISSDSITFLYEEKDQQGNGISITNALPVADSTGKVGQAFNFEISSKTASKIAIPYEITVRKKTGSDNLDDIVKLYLTKVDGSGNEEEVVLGKYSSFTTVIKNNHEEKLLTEQKVPRSSNNYVQKYRLRMWIDENTDFSSGNYNDKTFAVTVNVYANGSSVTNEDITNETNTNINKVTLNNIIIDPISSNHYEEALPGDTTSAQLVIKPSNKYAKVEIGKTDSTYQTLIAMNTSSGIQPISSPTMSVSPTIKLSSGDNYFKAIVTAEDGTTTDTLTFKITVTNTPSATNRLRNMILADNVVQEGDPVAEWTDFDNGLCVSYETNSKYPTYYYYGTVTNNYVNYANKVWRIVRINEDGTIRLILEDRIDTNEYVYNNGDLNAFNQIKTSYNFDASNTSDPDYATKFTSVYHKARSFSYYTSGELDSEYITGVSNPKGLVSEALSSWYQTNIASNANYSKWIADKSGNYFCEAFNLREPESTGNNYTAIADEGAYFGVANSYDKSLFTCNKDIFGHQYVDSNVGLLTNYEYLNASGDTSFYGSDWHLSSYLDQDFEWWLANSAGSEIGPDDFRTHAWAAEEPDGNGDIMVMNPAYTNVAKSVRPVVNLKASTTATKDQNGVYIID